MAGSSVDGLVSGIQTSTIISQLMQVESIGKTKLQGKVSTQQTITASLQAVNTRVSAMKTAAQNIIEPAAWNVVKGSSNSDAAVVQAGTGAATGEFTFDITKLAKGHVVTATVDAAGPVAASGSVTLTIGGTPTAVAVTTNTAQGLAEAINAKGLDVRAAVINADGGKTILQLTSTKTGEPSRFTIDGLTTTNGPTMVQEGNNAQLTVGSGLASYTVTSATNTFSNVLPNVTITVGKLATGVTATVTRNSDAIADKVAALVGAANTIISDVGAASQQPSSGKPGGALAGNPLARQLIMDTQSAISGGKTGYGSYAQMGIQLERGGKIAFDRAKFIAAYEANPAAVQTAVTTGLAKSLGDRATSAGTDITTVIQNGERRVRDLNAQITQWDVRLDLRQKSLQRQFSNLEVSLGKLRDQSNWLSGQIASLG